MQLHEIQLKILKVAKNQDLNKLSLREIGDLIGVDHPQQVKHHLSQLQKHNLIKTDKIERIKIGEIKGSNLVNVPILGSANCGEATIFADENIEGFLRISKRFLGAVKDVFAIRAKGPSMNKAKVDGKLSIEDGDYVIISKENKIPENGEYVLSVIDDVANIKKFYFDRDNNQINLLSESTENYPPIVIHPDDKYLVNGIVKYVVKKVK